MTNDECHVTNRPDVTAGKPGMEQETGGQTNSEVVEMLRLREYVLHRLNSGSDAR